MIKKKTKKGLIALLCIGLFSTSFLTFLLVENNLKKIRDENLTLLEEEKGNYNEKSIILKDTNYATAKEIADKLNAELRITKDGKFAALYLPDDKNVFDIYKDKKNRQIISKFSLDYHAKVSEVEEETNNHMPSKPNYTVYDNLYSNQSYINYVNVGETWKNYRGEGVTVAVIDTGIDYTHPEFNGKISQYSYNASKDKIVKDYVLADGEYDWSLIDDQQGHGTTVSGVISASMDGSGVVGIAPEANLLVIKAECDEKGVFRSTADLVFGIYYAIERGADVINMSFGGTTNVFKSAIELAVDEDIICVAAAGNDGSSCMKNYPASDENVIGVGALADNSWELASYSNFGDNSDVVAPGTTFTTLKGGQYGTMHGTSLASPIVAGAMALLKQQDRYIEFKDAKELLFASSYDIGRDGEDWNYGFGALDINALICEKRKTVTFDMLTDEVDNIKRVFIQNHPLQSFPEPERCYAVFDGWNYDTECEDEVMLYEDSWNDDITLYARWGNEEDTVPYSYITLPDNTIEITSYRGRRRYITIPSKIEGKNVTSVGNRAFYNQGRLRQINLPNTLTNIGESAFAQCDNLQEMVIPDTVKTIKKEAFKSNVRLRTIVINENSALSAIGSFAFSFSAINRFNVTKMVSELDATAFYCASELKEITVDDRNTNFSSNDGVLYNKSLSKVIAYPSAKNADYTIPSSVREIGNYAFAYSRFTEIDFNNVETIGEFAFQYSSLQKLALKDSITVIGKGAFSNNYFLKDITIGKGLSMISDKAFSGAFSLFSITIPANITEIGSFAFSDTGLKEVIVDTDSKLKLISNNVFQNAQLVSFNLPDSVEEIGEGAFCNNVFLEEITISNNSNLKTIGSLSFDNCVSLESISLPESLEIISAYAFSNSGLKESVYIPSNVTTIGAGAFSNADDLKEIKVDEGNANYIDVDGVVYNSIRDTVLAYPSGNNQSEYSICEGVKFVGESAFEGAKYLSSVILPSSLEEIHTRAFADMKSISSINIPDNVIQIASFAFKGSEKLTQINLNQTSKLPRISYAAFYGTGLTSFIVPSNVSTIGQYAFASTNLTSIVFSKNSKVDNISAYMFEGAEKLSYIRFENGSLLTAISAHGFEGLLNLSTIDFGDAKITKIGNYAFRNCEKLSSINIPNGVFQIGRYAFSGNKSLSQISIPSSVEYIGRYAFNGTNNIRVIFKAEELPKTLQENWDVGISGYYVGVEEVLSNGDWEYAKLSNGGISILKYNGIETQLDLTQIDLGGEINQIGGYAFYQSKLTGIKLPNSLKQIQRYAFANTNLEKISIPSSVTFIGQYAFYNTKVTSVIFQENSSIESIERYAFAHTYKLTSIILPSNLSQLGTCAFMDSGLEEIIFEEGSSLNTISASAFANTKVRSVVIPDSVNYIDDNAFLSCVNLESLILGSANNLEIHANAFYNTGLTSLYIPKNVKYIGEYAFNGLRGLLEYTVDENNEYYKSVDGVLYNKKESKLIAFPAGKQGTYTVPNSVETIGFGAFENSSLEKIDFEDGINLLTIGYRAFYNANNLKEISIPKSVVSIDYYAFGLCSSLESVYFHAENKLTGIYEGAFYGCISLNNITIPDSIIEISDFAFYGCRSLTKIPISKDSQIKGIYDYGFSYSGITDLSIPSTVIDIGDYAFRGIKAKTIVIPDDNKDQLIIGLGAFQDCTELVEISIPFIGSSFEDEQINWFGYIFGAGGYSANDTYVPTSLKKVVISEGITFIGEGAFYELESIEEIVVPHSVNLLYPYSFFQTKAKYELTNEITTVWFDNLNHPYFTATGSHFGEGISGSLVLSENVNAIEQNCFFMCKELESIIIPDSVTMIGQSSFLGCEKLTSVRLPNGITSIEYQLFRDCSSLTEITLPDTITSIGNAALSGCTSLSNVTIPKSVKEVGVDAFSGCTSLSNIVLPNGITEIQTGTFMHSGLTNIELPAALTRIHGEAFFGCSALNSIVISEKVSVIDDWAFYGCDNLFLIFNNSNLKLSIGSETFGNLCLKALLIVDKDGNKTYQNNNYFEVTDTSDGFRFIKESGVYKLIQYFGNEETITLPLDINGNEYIISSMQGGRNVIIPEGIKKIDSKAFFRSTSLKSVVLPNSLESIGSHAFFECINLRYINIPDNVYNIGEEAFYRCESLEEITIPNGVTKISPSTFFGCKSLKNISLPDTINSIGESAFCSCEKLEQIILPSNIKIISTSAISQCYNLTRIDIPDSVEQIASDAFTNCNKLSSIRIGKGVKLIGEGAFRNCPITSFEIDPDNDSFTIIDGIVYNKDITSIVFVSASVKKVVIPSSITDISISLSMNSNIEEVSFEQDVKIRSIGKEAFSGCINLKKVIIPNSVKIIDDDAFSGCVSIESIELPEGLEKIGGFGFYECESLKEISLPSGIASIGEYAFYNCSSLTTITLPNNITSIRNNTFGSCSSLEEVIIPEGVKIIEEGAFMHCLKLKGINLPTTIEEIQRSSFYNCITLSSITLPANLQSIDDNAFEKCYGLKKIINNSSISLEFNSTKNGYVSYYADVITDDSGTKYLYYRDGESLIYTSDGFVFSKDFTGEYKLRDYIGNEEEIELPLSIENNSYWISLRCNAKRIIVPEGIQEINLSAFENCSHLESIVFPNSLTHISSRAFFKCEKLMDISIPDKQIEIEKEAFLNSGYYLNQENWENGCLYIGNHLILVSEEVQLLTIKSDTKSIAEGALDNCHILKQVEVFDFFYKALSKLTNIETLVISSSIDNNIQDYFDRNALPITLKRVVLKEEFRLNNSDIFANINNIQIFVEDQKEKVTWDEEYPGWNNKNKVYYGDKWVSVNIYDYDNTLIDCSYYSTSNVIRMPNLTNFTIGAYTYVFLGFDTNSDGTVDFIPATSTINIFAKAVYEIKSVCDVYGHHLVEDQVIIDKPTCEGEGSMEVTTYCSVCKEVMSKEVQALEPSGHKSREWIIDQEATCIQEGHKHTECSVCGKVLENAVIPLGDHQYGEWEIDKQPTFDEEGQEHSVCKVCGHEEVRPIDKYSRVNEFIGIVSNVDKMFGEHRFNQILSAIEFYNTMNEDEKNQVSKEYAYLLEIINEYNNEIDKVNEEHNKIYQNILFLSFSALSGIVPLIYLTKKWVMGGF